MSARSVQLDLITQIEAGFGLLVLSSCCTLA